MMKPWQTSSNKAPSKRGKEGGPEPKEQNPEWVTKGQRNIIPQQLQEAYQKKKG